MSDRLNVLDDDNPEWTEDDFARSLRGDAIPAHLRAAFPNTITPHGMTEAKSRAKSPVSLRIDTDVLERFRAGGAGWQTRMNAALRKAAGLGG